MQYSGAFGVTVQIEPLKTQKCPILKFSAMFVPHVLAMFLAIQTPPPRYETPHPR